MTQRGDTPLFSAHTQSKIVIIGQAPGARTMQAEKPWADASGDRLRDWMGVSQDVFYDVKKIALVPMDFYFPGHGSAGDLPPRKDFADMWHPKILDQMGKIQLTLLVGQYAQAYYLGDTRQKNLTETVHNYTTYMRDGFFPLPHPSPRNNIWLKKNPWFAKDVLPALQKNIAQIL